MLAFAVYNWLYALHIMAYHTGYYHGDVKEENVLVDRNGYMLVGGVERGREGVDVGVSVRQCAAKPFVDVFRTNFLQNYFLVHYYFEK